jgi:serine/threonine protein kinase
VTTTVADIPRPSRPERIGRYRVVERIGRGAMGVVYSAHDEVMDRDVAVKVMMTDLEAEPDIRARFMREAQVSASLAHRNIVTIYDIGEDNGRLFIVMELLRGQTLDKCLKQRVLALEEKVDLTLEVCEGLAAANAAGVCHRDVKPANLFLQDDGTVKVLDFGIARLASSSMTASGFIVGTPDYMSPEQARGSGVDERSDVFSVGAVLYLMLSGFKPFVAPDLPAVLSKVVSEDPPPFDPEIVPAGLSRIVFKALMKDPAERYQNFAEFSADLARWRRRGRGARDGSAADARSRGT